MLLATIISQSLLPQGASPVLELAVLTAALLLGAVATPQAAPSGSQKRSKHPLARHPRVKGFDAITLARAASGYLRPDTCDDASPGKRRPLFKVTDKFLAPKSTERCIAVPKLCDRLWSSP